MEDTLLMGIYSSSTPIRIQSSPCLHLNQYWVNEHSGTGSFCGLCWLIEQFQDEVPGRIHTFKLLAENGNPETTETFIQHANLVMGIVPPKKGQSLHNYRHTRASNNQRPAYGRFPVTSALWEMMGYQPPLAEPLAYKLYGLADWDIAAKMGVSLYNIQIRLAKATRLALRYVRHDKTVQQD